MAPAANSQQIQDLEKIIEIQQEVVTSSFDLTHLMSLICERTQDLTHASAGVVEIAEGDDMVYRATTGTAKNSLGVRLNINTSLSGLSVRSNEVLYCEDSETDARVDREACRRVGARSMICVPLIYQQKAIGVLKVYSPEQKKFSERDISVLKITAGLLSASISQAREKTEKEAAHKAMTENEQKFRALFENSYDTIMVSRDNIVLEVNDAFPRVFGFAKEEIIGHSLLLVANPSETTKIQKNISQGVELPYEVECLHKDGSALTILVTGKTITLKGENIRMATLRDVTAQKKLERALRDSETKALEVARAKSEFLANMSHEIRTPLNGVMGMVNLIGETALDSEQRKYLEMIRTSADALLTIVNDILDFSKIEAKKLNLEMIDFELKPAVEDIRQILSFAASHKGLVFECHYDQNLTKYITGDPTRLRQIILNLASNAIKFTAKGSVIIGVKEVLRDGQKVKLKFSIQDTGIGIPAAAIKNLFQSFSQVDASTTRKYGGTGLGLSICRQLVEMMGGEIGVNSTEKVGSEFWFTITFPIVPFLKDANLVKIDFKNTVQKKWRILIAEDNTVNQMIVKSMLQKPGHTLTIVANGQEAIDALNIAPYDVVLMDCQMPEMDGFEATKQIRKSAGAWKDIPIIAMTANAMAGDRERCLAAGMNDYVSKPMRVEDLLTALQKNLK
ncbi:hypothetical protein CIK05_05920 [Bdellovibrio sp. qaytius]|nr:hypothetical protein CIK05_05920 [Bdellovibrio sp. qaytius]